MEDIREDCIAGFSLMAMFVLLLIAVVVSGCSKKAVAYDASPSGRFSLESVESVDGARNVDVSVLRDSETGREWLYVRDTTFGKTSIDIEPMDWSEEDGAVSD